MPSDLPWLLVLAGLVLLAIGGDCLARGSTRLARRTRLSPVVIGATLAPIALASPVLVVVVEAAMTDRGDVAVGCAIGATSFAVGCGLAVGAIVLPLRVSVRHLRAAMPGVVLAALLAAVVLADGRLVAVEAALLLAVFAAHTVLTVRFARGEQALAVREEYAAGLPAPSGPAATEAALVGVGLVVLAVGARLAVDGAASLARAADASESVVGLTVVAIGASLPAFSATLVAAFRRQPDVVVGGIAGACVFNLLGCLGVAALAAPLRAQDVRALDLGVMAGFAVLLLPFLKSGFRLQRWEGALLAAAYVAYLVHLVHGGRPPD